MNNPWLVKIIQQVNKTFKIEKIEAPYKIRYILNEKYLWWRKPYEPTR